MENITILATWHGAMTVQPGKAPGARLVWQAPGLDIYVRGTISKHFDVAGNIALNECISRRIPAVSVRRVGR